MLLFYPLQVGKGFRIFPKDISEKVNVIARLEFELVYHNVSPLRLSLLYEDSFFISCKNAGRHKALSFVGKGKGAVLQ